MTEVLFYHLERQGLEAVLPTLVEKCLERSWRVVVQAGSRERRDALDSLLWTYRDDSFLPHGTSADGPGEDQPVFLTAEDDNPNGATVRFLVDRAAPGDIAPYQRVVFLFDGNDPDALKEARDQWRAVKAEGHDLTYWQQSPAGRWERKA
ncbi:DNA polymerase III, chi subunit [Pseudoxanthobacter soli DSM 19599]|uniref:DNA polymerase III, chi subunit n=1 Tax=Pseudoxanthobacter soli DSM 19599 TaxID=1123029 RepID=A0A1M7ZLA6_9HYPH|nr:DNA polymerase III subunit chi [Pseudoxanthobacter soli]SHO65674.1 DNA polymerase III, chi subunit [Pseudoxanthobacter soli DSM 19599]